MGTSEADKKAVALILRRMCDSAIEFGDTKGGKFKQLISEFQQNPVPTYDEIVAKGGLGDAPIAQKEGEESGDYYSEGEEDGEEGEAVE